MVNIARQYNIRSCFIDGKFLSEDIEAFNVPDLEILTFNANADIPPLNFELTLRGEWREMLAAVGKAAGKPMRLEVRASIENNYGKSVYASWKCRGRSMNIPTPFMPTLKLNADFYEHIIDGEEKYYIDIWKTIRRVDGVDQLKAIREGL